METSGKDRVLDFSDRFVLSSGTVSIDCLKGLVLLLYYRPKGEYLLPKGRKNVGETLQGAAVRETMEESGYKCHLLGHDLPTKAPDPIISLHTEPIAVQQRMSQGVRKIIFWYLAQVDSSDPPIGQTLEEGEDFEVRWVRKEIASSTMSFVEDQKIVEKALSVLICSPIDSVPAIPRLREGYLDSSFNPQALGFLCISLGGSLVYGQQDVITPLEIENLTDWDGFGIVNTKEDILTLINDFKPQLCALLWIEKEEYPNMKLPEDSELLGEWDVLRFSGWTKQGSKRTIKIWSKSCLCNVASESMPSQIGVLSYKVARFTRCDHPKLGPRLFIYQPRKVTEQLHVLHDSDFLGGSDMILSSKHRPYKAVSPGVSCDLFLTSLCLFEHEPNTVASFKAMIMQKWQSLSGADEMESIMPLFYRAATMGHSYWNRLHTELAQFDLPGSANTRKTIARTGRAQEEPFPMSAAVHRSGYLPMQLASAHFQGYWSLYFAPLQWQRPDTSHGMKPVQPAEYSYPIVHDIRDDGTPFAPTPFSSNSTGLYAKIVTSSGPNWQRVYVKTAHSVPAELGAFPMVRQWFPNGSVQTIAAAEPATGRIFFGRFDGDVLNQISLRYHHGLGPIKANPKDWNCLCDEWFIDLDLRRAQDVLTVYAGSFRPIDPSIICSQQRIHAFFHYRLQKNSGFQRFYGGDNPSFLQHTGREAMNLEVFLDSPVIINGQSHQSLRYYLNRASRVLDPDRVGGLNTLPIAFGFGDGHGGNVMVSSASSPPSMLYVDYEVAGHHPPFLDLAKPIYQDGFFDIAYADVLYGDLTLGSHHKEVSVKWWEDAGSIHIDYHLDLKPLNKGLAVIKLEYLLRPMLEALDRTAPHQRELAEEVLANGLFACALLTRNYSTRVDVFYLNMAIGVRLAAEMRGVFADCFNWCNWPPHTIIMGRPISGPGTSMSSNAPQDLSYLNPRHARSQFVAALEHMQRGKANQTFNPELLDGFGDLEQAILVEDRPKDMAALIRNLLFGISTSPEVEVYCLKRETETLALHRKFSSTPDESAWIVTRRISDVRKEAMRIAPHTCIRECLFAESRIDRHFVYRQILSDVAVMSSKTLIDVGCCMATDIRTLIAHGYPASNIMGLDCERGFVLYNQPGWALGPRFRQADVLEPHFFDKCSDLANAFDFVHTANVIHLYDEAHQEAFLRALAFLAKPGGMIWGRQVGINEDHCMSRYRQPEGKGVRFTVNQFRQLWSRATGWDTAQAQFEATLTPYEELRSPRADKRFSMQWSIRAPADKTRWKILDLD
ncbi:MAG: hypothetical protein Q9217_004780 [Psora testacea]